MTNKVTGLKRIFNAAGYSLAGLKSTYIHEGAFRQELALFVILVPLSIWLGESAVERALMIGSLFIILITELLNSAIEAIVDHASPEYTELAGRAKDAGSAAVMLSLITAAIIWLLILFL